MKFSPHTTLVVVAVLGILLLNGNGSSVSESEGQLAATGKTTTKGYECATKARPREFAHEPYYSGPLADSHLHLPVSSTIVSTVGERLGFKGMPAFGGKLTRDYLACLLKSEGITKVFAFAMTTRYSLSAELQSVAYFAKAHSGLIAPFYMPGPYESLRIEPSKAARGIDKTKGLFKGIGELKSFEKTEIDNPHTGALLKIAEERAFLTMMHPLPHELESANRLVKQFPKVKFLVHGGKDNNEVLAELMRRYPNVSRSLDADLTALYGNDRRHQNENLTKDEWLAYMRNNFDKLLESAVGDWKEKIEREPSRFLWGTDRWYDWHFDEEVGALITEWSRAFIGRLSPEVREQFAYKNALILLGDGK